MRYGEYLDKLIEKFGPPSTLHKVAHGKSGFGLRHDVDHDIEKALVMARYEDTRKISSTYFIMPDGEYNFGAAANIFWHGHEIGYHYDCDTRWALSEGERSTLEMFKDGLDALTREFPVYGCSAHGVTELRRNGITNLGFWNRHRLVDFGLVYEAYFLPHTIYISDSGGKFNVTVSNGKNWSFTEFDGGMSYQGIMDWLDKCQFLDDDIVQVLVHPLWWEV